MSDKFSNLLTMLLVLIIVSIFGIVGYFAYDVLNSNNINENAQSAINDFQSATQKVNTGKGNTVKDTNTVVDNKVENTTIDEENTATNPLEELNQLTQNQVAQQPTQDPTLEEPEKVYMEDYEIMGTIRIPKTGIEYPVLGKLTTRSLEIAVAIARGPGLNEVGNTVIFGHNYRNGLFFSDNDKLGNGDKIYITDKYGREMTYEVYNIYQTTQSDATYFTRDTEGRREISLQTCTDDGNNRIIIWAKEV